MCLLCLMYFVYFRGKIFYPFCSRPPSLGATLYASAAVYFILQLHQLTTIQDHTSEKSWEIRSLRRTARECRPYVRAIAKRDVFCSHFFHLTSHATHTSHVQTSCRNPFHYIDCIYCIVLYIYIYCIYWIYLIYCKHCIFVPKSCIPCSTSELSAALD